MLRHNPISGWKENKEWILKQNLKSELGEGNSRIVQLIEQKFCPINSYDIDLNS